MVSEQGIDDLIMDLTEIAVKSPIRIKASFRSNGEPVVQEAKRIKDRAGFLGNSDIPETYQNQ